MIFAAVLPAVLPAAGTVQGTVRAQGSEAPISSAVVRFPERGRSAVTDVQGFWVLPDLPAGSWRLRVSALGYEPTELVVQVPASGVVRLETELAPRPLPPGFPPGGVDPRRL